MSKFERFLDFYLRTVDSLANSFIIVILYNFFAVADIVYGGPVVTAVFSLEIYIGGFTAMMLYIGMLLTISIAVTMLIQYVRENISKLFHLLLLQSINF